MNKYGGDSTDQQETENYQLVIEKYENNSGYDILEMLQRTQSDEIYQRVMGMSKLYFNVQEDDDQNDL
jgi:hypothetical protein